MRKRIPFYEYNVEVGEDVFVYKNLRYDCWSIRVGRKVKQHANVVWLTDVTFKVSQAGRRRVLREGRKNVHAGLEGTLINYTDASVPDHPVYRKLEKWYTIQYNPYRIDYFLDNKTNKPLFYKQCVLMVSGHRTFENGLWYPEDSNYIARFQKNSSSDVFATTCLSKTLTHGLVKRPSLFGKETPNENCNNY